MITDITLHGIVCTTIDEDKKGQLEDGRQYTYTVYTFLDNKGNELKLTAFDESFEGEENERS